MGGRVQLHSSHFVCCDWPGSNPTSWLHTSLYTMRSGLHIKGPNTFCAPVRLAGRLCESTK